MTAKLKISTGNICVDYALEKKLTENVWIDPHYIKSVVKSNGPQIEAVDECIDDLTLRAKSCYDGNISAYNFVCPKGCKDGACV